MRYKAIPQHSLALSYLETLSSISSTYPLWGQTLSDLVADIPNLISSRIAIPSVVCTGG